MSKKIEKSQAPANGIKKSFLTRIRESADQWASDDFFVPVFVTGAGSSEEILSHLSFESSHTDAFLADRDSTSLKPDLLVISGIINYKNLKNIKLEYSRLVGRKYVVVIGNSDSMTRHLNSYNIVNDIQEHIPVDLFIHGNPPSRPEIIAGLNKLKGIRR